MGLPSGLDGGYRRGPMTSISVFSGHQMSGELAKFCAEMLRIAGRFVFHLLELL
jgi:hypothetical protein